MTDAATIEPDDAGERFHIVPDAELYLRIERRVGDLERIGAAGSPIDELRGDLAAMRDRLDRHREELELIKIRFGQLVDYVQQTVPAAPAPNTNRSALL